ncbi:MAG: restriction endonuclease subunit S [Syntrophales bacterium]|nr:restriction endonuclease subunit S [Syntrophales bacterium]
MSDSWTACTIQDFLTKGEAETKTGPFGTQLHASDYIESGTPVINARNIGFGDIRIDKLEFISKETVQRLSSHLLESGDIVFGRKGTVERHVFIRPEQTHWFQGTDCLRLRLKSASIQPRFVSYCLLTDFHNKWIINQSSHGATMTSLNQDIISRIPLRLPSLATQRKIVAILSAYDDLIENNLRRIKILEEMAQTLCREWFVKFRFPGHENACFVNSPLGQIPESWEVVKIKDVADVNARSIRKKDTLSEITYIDIASVSPGSIDKMEIMAFTKSPNRARRITRHGDIIWSSVRPNRRSFSLIIDPPANLIVSTGFAVISAKKVPFTYLFQATTTDDFVIYLVNHAKGAAYPAVNAYDFENADILVPSKQLLSSFDDKALPIAIFTHRLKEKNTTLRRTRDLLLPKLISGEVDVSELDITVPEEVAA